MTTRLDLPSGGWADFTDPDELTYRQEEVLRRAATVLYLERKNYATAHGIAEADMPTYPTQDEMMALDLGPFERQAAGALCVRWSHACHPPSDDPAQAAWMDDAPRADVRLVLAHAVRLSPSMTDTTQEGATPGAPFDGSNTSPTSSIPMSTPTPPGTTTPPSGPGGSSPSPAGPSPTSTPPPPVAAPTSS